MYDWRKMTPEQRAYALQRRRSLQRPWHGPPHRNAESYSEYLFTAACFEHKSHIGLDAERMGEFEQMLLGVLAQTCEETVAWVVLPNHYHALTRTGDALGVLAELGRLHGRTSHRWNGLENTRGRKVWHRAVETVMKGDGHFWATVNYVHNNLVKHGYAKKWGDWPFGNAREYIKAVGHDEARRIWKLYPIDDYGKGWDD